MRIFRYNSPLMTFLSRLADLMILNMLWLLCCLPIITAGAATTALYSCAMNLDEPNEQPVFRRFFQSFRTGFGKSTALFAIWVIMMALVLVNLWFYLVLLRDPSQWLRVLPLIPAVLILLVSNYLFPLQARFENSLLGTVKNAFSLTLVHLPTTVVITAIHILPVLVLYYFTDIFVYLLAVWTLFGFALLTYLSGHFLKKVFDQHLPQSEENENEEDI